jgi:hypothetical protein
MFRLRQKLAKRIFLAKSMSYDIMFGTQMRPRLMDSDVPSEEHKSLAEFVPHHFYVLCVYFKK